MDYENGHGMALLYTTIERLSITGRVVEDRWYAHEEKSMGIDRMKTRA